MNIHDADLQTLAAKSQWPLDRWADAHRFVVAGWAPPEADLVWKLIVNSSGPMHQPPDGLARALYAAALTTGGAT